MYRGHTVAVVVPAYNEEGFVGEVLETVPDYVDRIYAIDDDSSDGTWAEIRCAAAVLNEIEGGSDRLPTVTTTNRGPGTTNRVVPIQHETNRGVGGAIKTGYVKACDDVIDITAVMGGDGQMDPDLLSRFLDPIVEREVDYTKGNRLLYPEYRRDMSAWRLFGNSILSYLTKMASGYWKMMDPQNGYTAISLDALQTIDLDGMYEDYGYCNDLLVKLNVEEMRVADVPMPAVYGDEESGIQYSTYIPKVSGMLFRNFCWRLRTRYLASGFNPLVLGYIFGVFVSLAGAVSGARALLSGLQREDTAFDRIATSGRLLLSGTVFLSLAVLFDMRKNEELEVHQYE
ncbi:glycosyltransferase family 2 protein [Natronorubrum thiooxidans]|uniref:Glycosyltransferase involved in cell wall bisynthesis n=1 Tax=Natronorubrum thiooxidans TaxID=308853 RepID=A0A1N7FRW2_9EURY|nr:glycosyltransferase family 2 protein [Natronorubrum thiooxidans]SIS03017.1 Glycosyltransferase involved in cell wall bisynthesis [Natronorubrum thiooxidans]